MKASRLQGPSPFAPSILIASTCLFLASVSPTKAAPAHPTEAEVMNNIFNTHCIVCHGKRVQEADLDLRTRESMIRGGKSGPALIPGKAASSLVYQKIARNEMPPKKNIFGDQVYVRRVDARDISALKNWINAGSPQARRQSLKPDFSPTPADTSPRGNPNHWAFQPPRPVSLPPVAAPASLRNPIDNFILSQLEEKGLSFSPPAPNHVLIRRASFDLTGLPPDEETIDTFISDTQPGAYERMIERLLASPHYGERWAKYWLDGAGYTDTHGVIDRDQKREYIFRYRDYVIRAFNSDKPYDRFVTEQLAGDELEDYQSIDRLTPDQIDALVATGFLRTAPDATDEGAFSKVVDRFAVLHTQLDIVSTALMGLTLECARCHDHKFDPITITDYYRFSAIFRTAYDPYDWRTPDPIMHPHNLEVPAWNQRFIDHPSDPGGRIHGLADLGGDPTPVHVLHRGDLRRPRERVQAGVPEAVAGAIGPLPTDPDCKNPRSSGNRLALARWLTHPDHPLTARVMVNKVWQHHFGRPIVATPGNLGFSGSPPTHPQLLDWLSIDFVQSGWSLKSLHRRIMHSQTYRQSSQVRSPGAEKDPEGILLSRYPFRRLDAEAIRDSIFKISGQLDPKMYGPAIDLERSEEGEFRTPPSAEGTFRRSLYGIQRHMKQSTLLELFDGPAMTPNCLERSLSTVPTQALQLWNSEQVRTASMHLAARLLRTSTDRVSHINHLYRLVFARHPSHLEHQNAQDAIEGLEERWRSSIPSESPSRIERNALATFSHVLLNSPEFLFLD